MSSKRSHEGYLMIDHRASPGIPADKARQMGIPVNLGEGVLFEAPTITCTHCGTVVILNPGRTRERAYCRSCDSYICDNCGNQSKQPGYIHVSFNQIIDTVRNLGVKTNNG